MRCSLFTALAAILHLAPPACAAPASAVCSLDWNGSVVQGRLEDGVCRTTVRYGSAARWEDSVAATSQSGIDASALPPSCPQYKPGGPTAGPTESEDCLTATIYWPVGGNDLPVYIWLHGGSFLNGSGAAPGLDGGALARTGVVVVVLQYRLGVLGFIPPLISPAASDPNLGVRDVILALKQVKQLPAWMIDRNSITLGGHSSGASLVRTLWGVPAAVGLFNRMIMQSDPLNLGLASMKITGELQRMLYSNDLFRGCTTMADYQAVPLSDVIEAQETWSHTALGVQGVPRLEPVRPSYGTATIPNEPISSLFHNAGALALHPRSVALLLSTTADEGGGLMIGEAVPPAQAAVFYGMAMDQERAAAIIESEPYSFPNGTVDARPMISRPLTDGGWRCSTRETARMWAGAGGRVYVGEFREGVHYPDNNDYPYCREVVCHSEDIIPTFGHTAGPFGADVLHRWTSFIKTGKPGADWPAYRRNSPEGADIHALGGDGQIPKCPCGFWGTEVKWDWQMFT